MHVHVEVVTVSQLNTRDGAGLARTGGRVGGAALEVGRWEFTLTQVNAARKRAGIVVDPVVGNLQVMAPAVHKDAAAALRAVGDAQAIDARRIALEVAGEWIRPCSGPATAGRKQSRAGGEPAQKSGVVGILSVEVDSFGQDRNACSFERAHQRG